MWAESGKACGRSRVKHVGGEPFDNKTYPLLFIETHYTIALKATIPDFVDMGLLSSYLFAVKTHTKVKILRFP